MHFVAAEKCALELIDHELQHLLVRARVFAQLNLIGNVTEVSSDKFWYRGWFVILSEFVCRFGECCVEGLLQLGRGEV